MVKIAAASARCDDRSVVAGLRRGDSGSVEALVDCHGGWIYRVARRLLGDPRDAQEVTQDVLLTVVHKIGAFKGAAKLSSWIYRIAANATYERLRSRRSQAEVSLEPLLPVFDDEEHHAEAVADWSRRLDDPAIAAELRSALERGIVRLPGEYRVVVLLRDVEGLTNEETADALRLTVAAVKSRLHRARLALRQELAEFFRP